MLIQTKGAKNPTKAQLKTFQETCETIAGTDATKRVAGKLVQLEDIDCANSMARYLGVMHGGETLTASELDTAKENWAAFRDTFQAVNVLTSEAQVTRVGKARLKYDRGIPVAEVRSLTTSRDLSTDEQIARLKASIATLEAK